MDTPIRMDLTPQSPEYPSCSCSDGAQVFFQVVDGKLRRIIACTTCGTFMVVPLPEGV